MDLEVGERPVHGYDNAEARFPVGKYQGVRPALRLARASDRRMPICRMEGRRESWGCWSVSALSYFRSRLEVDSQRDQPAADDDAGGDDVGLNSKGQYLISDFHLA